MVHRLRSSYSEEDVIFLLKDITGLVQPQTTEERERLIQKGRHYCEMLPIEYTPSREYMEIYKKALGTYAGVTAFAIGRLADKIVEARGKDVVLVSLARAGTPIGILLKRYLKYKYGIDNQHYSISIIRRKGIDANAMKFLLKNYSPEKLMFIDGWTGKGAIFQELKNAMEQYPNVSPDIAVVADPANLTELCGTHEDILIPSSCLNCTISGLVSRTFLQEDIIHKDDYHGAVYYGELKDSDLSYEFIHAIEAEFRNNGDMHTMTIKTRNIDGTGLDEVKELANVFHISDLNLIKPGIGETTRVLLRRLPWKVFISETCRTDPVLAHIIRLAEEKGVEIAYYPLKHYKACGIIKKLSDL